MQKYLDNTVCIDISRISRRRKKYVGSSYLNWVNEM